MNKDLLLRTLERWHDEDQHQKIIDTIHDLPEEDVDYTLKSLLARALNNLDRMEDAVQVLLSIESEGTDDPMWYYRLGYAYYYLHREEEALPLFQRAYELAPDEDTQRFIDLCEQGAPLPGGPVMYSEEEQAAIEQHIARYFGPNENVFHELISYDIHVDIYIVEPTPERNYYTLVTGGMGARPMNVPEELEDEEVDRAELLITLPPDWNLQSQDENDYWPIYWLKVLARLPINENDWLGYGHTIETGEGDETIAPNAPFQGLMLVTPQEVPEAAHTCRLPNGDAVRFYQVIPLFKEEMDYKLDHDADALIDRMEHVSHVVNIYRKNTCASVQDLQQTEKDFYLKADEIYPLLNGWDEADGCFASDRITVDGCKVGYMYRETPDEEWTADSGWRFLAGDEDEAYMDDPDKVGLYRLNTVCNYDRDIIPLLHAPYNTAYERGDDGKFHECEFTPSTE